MWVAVSCHQFIKILPNQASIFVRWKCLPFRSIWAAWKAITRKLSQRDENGQMECAGMSEMDIYNRSRDFLHYGLPYDAPPPEEE